MQYRDRPLREVLLRLALILIPAWALLPLTFVIPRLDSTRPPYFDLTGWIGVAAYGAAESGGWFGVPIAGLVLLVVLLSRSGITWKHRGIEAGVIVVAAGGLLAGTAQLNEHLLKPAVAIPRPNIVQLAETPSGAPPEQTVLGRTPGEFYALPDKDRRSDALRASRKLGDFPLHPLVREHWIAETGFSLPSGHSLSAFLFATFFLAIGLSVLTGWRRGILFLVVPWAVLIGYSRPILRVHSPTDITVGGLAGLMLGLVGFLAVREVLKRIGGAT